MDPEYLNSDVDDVIPISPPSFIIDITDSDDDTVVLDSETVKSQRQSNIAKIFPSLPSQPSSSSSEPTAVDLKKRTISGVEVIFPVEPYSCQINVTSKIITAINEKVNCLVESPTGTGKTFALLCASLAWQLKEKEKVDEARLQLFSNNYGISGDDDEFKKKIQNFDASKLPPCRRELEQQILRAKFISSIWSNATAAHPTSLEATDFGWKEVDGFYELKWFDGEEAPHFVREITIDTEMGKGNIDKSVAEYHSKLDPKKQNFSPNKTDTTVPTPLYIKQNFGGKSIYDNHIEDIGKSYLNVIQNQPGPSTTDNYSSNDNLVRLHKKPRIDTSYVGQTSLHYPPTPEKKEVRKPTTPDKNRNTSFSLDESMSNMKEICYVAHRLPVIYYGARTHKQLEQVVQEYGKTIYCHQATMTILSSRENSCIRAYDRRQWSSKKEMCKSCIKTASSNNSNNTLCEYYDNRYNLDHKKLPSAFDLNVLKEKGREHRACPYYAARYMKEDANIVFCPYNFLIDPIIRKSMGIYIENDIIIIDEGHNIEDICRQTATFSFTIDQVEAALKELKYAVSFVEPLINVLNNWVRWLNNYSQLLETKPVNEDNIAIYDWDVNNFIQTLDDYNIGKSQYPDFKKNVTLLSDKIRNNPDMLKQITTSTVTFLESLDHILGYIFGEYLDSFKPLLEVKYKDIKDRTTTAFQNRWNWQYYKLHLYCLNPAVVFSQLRAARSVVLASGTLAPLDSLESELGTTFKYKVTDRHAKLEKKVWVGKLGFTKYGEKLFCHNRGLRHRETQLELGRVLQRVCSVMPHGVLCFLPSYAVLQMLYTEWSRSGILSEIKKRIFRESNDIEDHEAVMKEYTAEAAKDSGALLLAVYRGKAAEGMDFRDEQARAVVLVGIPYPNEKNEAVRTKMEYNDAQKMKHQRSGDTKWLSGKEWLNVQAFRALNQAMGRCVRHERDWGAVLLLDARYSRPDYLQHISEWARRRACPTVFDYNSLIDHSSGIKVFEKIMTEKETEDKNGKIQEN